MTRRGNKKNLNYARNRNYNRNPVSKNRNNVDTRTIMEKAMKDILVEDRSVLIGIPVLTIEQLAIIAIIALEVTLFKIITKIYPPISKGGKNRPTKQPLWKAITVGNRFSCNECGAVITYVSNVDNKDKKWGGANIILLGDERVNSSHMALIAHWNKTDIRSLKYPPIFFDEVMVQYFIMIKKNLIKHQGESHFGSWGYNVGFGFKADCNPPETTRKHLATMSRYATTKIGRKKAEEIFGKTDVDGLDSDGIKELVKHLDEIHQEYVTTTIMEAITCVNASTISARGIALAQLSTVVNRAMVQACHQVNNDLKSDVDLLGGTNFPSVYLNVNASTDLAHTEADSSPTIIYTPAQRHWGPDSVSPRDFHLVLNDGTIDDALSREFATIVINMKVGLGLIFHSYFVMHQQLENEFADSSLPFFNVSAYGAKALFENCRTTIARNLKQCYENVSTVVRDLLSWL